MAKKLEPREDPVRENKLIAQYNVARETLDDVQVTYESGFGGGFAMAPLLHEGIEAGDEPPVAIVGELPAGPWLQVEPQLGAEHRAFGADRGAVDESDLGAVLFVAVYLEPVAARKRGRDRHDVGPGIRERRRIAAVDTGLKTFPGIFVQEEEARATSDAGADASDNSMGEARQRPGRLEEFSPQEQIAHGILDDVEAAPMERFLAAELKVRDHHAEDADLVIAQDADARNATGLHGQAGSRRELARNTIYSAAGVGEGLDWQAVKSTLDLKERDSSDLSLTWLMKDLRCRRSRLF